MAYSMLLALLLLGTLPLDILSLCDKESTGGVCKDIILPPDKATCIDPALNKNQPSWACGTRVTPNQQARVLDDNGIDRLLNMIKKELGQEEEIKVPLEVGVTGSESLTGTCNTDVSLDDTKAVPFLRYKYAASGNKYLLVMADPDTPGCEKSDYPCYYLHWVVTDIPGTSLLTPSQLTSGRTLLAYTPPAPPSGTHRYQFMLFDLGQGRSISDIPDSNHRGNFDLNYFIGVHDLCDKLEVGFQYRATAPK